MYVPGTRNYHQVLSMRMIVLLTLQLVWLVDVPGTRNYYQVSSMRMILLLTLLFVLLVGIAAVDSATEIPKHIFLCYGC